MDISGQVRTERRADLTDWYSQAQR
ncbi:hypothetical protein SGPA1_21509 [Streptomyces misionensis JCM 4497]